MVGGMVTATLLTMFVVPVAYLLMRQPRRARGEKPVFQNTGREAV
jgi:Cu(I)/Ag(I) efflux system membrane protein CusA/SilA